MEEELRRALLETVDQLLSGALGILVNRARMERDPSILNCNQPGELALVHGHVGIQSGHNQSLEKRRLVLVVVGLRTVGIGRGEELSLVEQLRKLLAHVSQQAQGVGGEEVLFAEYVGGMAGKLGPAALRLGGGQLVRARVTC